MPVVAVVVVPVDIARIEVHVPSVVRVVRIEGRRPVVAVGTGIVKVRVVPVTGGGKDLPLSRPPDRGRSPPLTFSEDYPATPALTECSIDQKHNNISQDGRK